MPKKPKSSYASINLTNKCNLRCSHCWYHREAHPVAPELSADEFLEKLAALQDEHNITSVTWVGGEPLLRLDILERATPMFSQNIISTNGTFPLPPLPAIYGVSIDGPESVNDEIRGKGVYRKAKENASGRVDVLVLHTVTPANERYLETFAEEILEWQIGGLYVSFYTPAKGGSSSWCWPKLEDRDGAVRSLIELKERYPNFIVNPLPSTQFMLSEAVPEVVSECDIVKRCISLEHDLSRRYCCFGNDADCGFCGAPTVYIKHAHKKGLLASDDSGIGKAQVKA
jgi:MoaA/NifB/PqqE/SkfB family radical SAM enzyme